ncbi:MAG: hypothetical protein ACREKM_09180, partial [Longimicrobiales bacterium]
ARHTAAIVAVAVSGCAQAGDPQEPANTIAAVLESGVAYEADTRVMESFPVQIATVVTATNTRSRSIDITFPDGCVVLLRAYSDAARTQLVWDQGEHVGCTMALVEWDLAPGTSQTARAGTGAREILGDALPDGEYWLDAVLRPDGRTVTVPAGSVQLAIPRG